MLKKRDFIEGCVKADYFALKLDAEGQDDGEVRFVIKGMEGAYDENEMRGIVYQIFDRRRTKVKVSKANFLLREQRPLTNEIDYLEVQHTDKEEEYMIPGVSGTWTDEELDLVVDKWKLRDWMVEEDAMSQF